MTLADKIRFFFKTIEDAWDAVPGYVKVFIYATATVVATEWINGSFDIRTIFIAVLINLGLYQGPRSLGTGIKTLIK